MNKLREITSTLEKEIFIQEAQEAFQKAYIQEFGPYDTRVLPKGDIEESFKGKNSKIYFYEEDGIRYGGTIVVINEDGMNHLDILYVNALSQNKGIGLKIWQNIEAMFPNTKVWETHTPYFDKRNIHFYVNRCKFKVTELLNPKHPVDGIGDKGVGGMPKEHSLFFKFEKVMNK